MLSVKNLSVGFYESNGVISTVIKNINFHLNHDETLGIVGESGSGKSLTALSIMRLEEYIGAKRFSGNIFYEKKDLTRLSENELNTIRGKDIAMIFQDPFSSFNPLMKIADHINEVLIKHTGLNKKQRKEKILELFDLVKLSNPSKIMESYPHEMSGGMLQRIMIVMAIACNPKILIADEITTALDTTIQKKIIQLLKEIQRKYRMSIIFISHDLSLVANVADRTMVMYAGQIVETAPTKKIFLFPHHPYTQGLIQSLPEKNIFTKQLSTIPGNIPHYSQRPSGCLFHNRCPYVMNWCKKDAPPLAVIDHYHESRCILAPNIQKIKNAVRTQYMYLQN